ncbi:alpha/beta hydrolase [Glaciibacter flavus]|uniref:alpha/beta hydrolase n=1 Tax=Orlajensenia flava TaxID=2565934 RepID=UPI001F1A9FBA|nr:alpha/beta hydrolase [Glaciibacter flavus]
MRTDVSIPSGSGALAGWLYLPTDAREPLPVVVMAHGLGAVKEMRLDAYADRFAASGYAVVVFDYRHFGSSTGQPRQLLTIQNQLQDWRTALTWVRSDERFDADRIALWGTSFGGGHVIRIAAEDHGVAAVIAQCPFTDGWASTRAVGLISSAKVVALGLRDRLAARCGKPPVMIASAGPRHAAALMAGPGCESGYLALGSSAPAFRNQVAARFGLTISHYRPGTLTSRVTAPVLFGICDPDTVAPASATRRHAARAPHGEVREYQCGHFDIYFDDWFERAVADDLEFLGRHVPVTASSPR